jgi:hypothetical protein
MARFSETLDLLLRNPSALLVRIHQGSDVRDLPLHLTLIAAAGLGAFGLMLGLSRSILWGLVAAPKLVLVALGTVALCLPALYVCGRVVTGSDSRPLEVVCEVLVAMASAALTLFALCPVWLVFAGLVARPPWGYFHVMLGAVALLALAGARGAWILVRSLRSNGRPVLHLVAWTLLYGLVGIQAAWVARPFVGNPASRDANALFRPLEGSAFDATHTLIESNMTVLSGDDGPRGGE